MFGGSKLRRHLAILFLCLGLLPFCSTAQTGLPGAAPTPPPAPTWETILPGGAYEYFSTPDQACRRQHQAFNPNATYQAPKYAGPWTYSCRWLASQFGGPPGSTTVLPTNVYLLCPSGYDRTRNGECRDPVDKEPECDCTEETRIQSTGPTPILGNPISIATGSKIDYQLDFSTADGLFDVGRSYRSLQHSSRRYSTTPIPGFGPNWHGILPGRLAVYGTYADYVEYLSAAGGYDLFVATGNTTNGNTWTFKPAGGDVLAPEGAMSRRKFEALSAPGVTRLTYFQSQPAVLNGPAEFKLTEGDGTFTLYRRADSWNSGDALRYLIPIERTFPGGYTLYFDYPDVGEYPNKVRDSFGREMLLSWAETKKNSLFMAPGGSSSTTIYDTTQSAKVITEIQLPDTTKLVYTYDGTSTETRIGRDDRLS